MQETKIFHIKPLQSGTRLNFTKTRDDDENTVIVKQLSGYGKFMADLKTSLTLFRDGLAAVKFAEVMIDGLVVQKFSEMIFDTQQLILREIRVHHTGCSTSCVGFVRSYFRKANQHVSDFVPN